MVTCATQCSFRNHLQDLSRGNDTFYTLNTDTLQIVFLIIHPYLSSPLILFGIDLGVAKGLQPEAGLAVSLEEYPKYTGDLAEFGIQSGIGICPKPYLLQIDCFEHYYFAKISNRWLMRNPSSSTNVIRYSPGGISSASWWNVSVSPT